MAKKKSYKIKEGDKYYIVELNKNMKPLGSMEESNKDKGILIQAGIQIGLKTLKYDKKLYTKKDVEKFLDKLNETECPVCKKYLSLVLNCIDKGEIK